MQYLIFIVVLLSFSLNAKGQEVEESPPYPSGFIRFQKNYQHGLLNKDKKVILRPIYDNVSDVSYGLIRAERNNKVGFFDTLGTLKIPFEYDVDTLNRIGSYYLQTEEHDSNGQLTKTTIWTAIDDNFVNFQEGRCAVIKNGKYGFIDTNNNIVLPVIYDAANNYYNGYAVVALGDKFGIIDTAGNFKIPCIYDLLLRGEYGRFYASLDREGFPNISLDELVEQVALRNRARPPLEFFYEQRRN